MNSPTKHKLDIFEVLNNIDLKNRNYCKTLSDDQKKAFAPFVVMRWLTGTGNARQVYFINEIVNPYAFSLQKHKELLMYLMMICTTGKKQRYSWVAPSKKKKKTSKLISLVQKYFGYNQKHAIDALPLLTDDDLLSYATQLGYQKNEITEIKKELKNRE